jgi:hypothetical protein
MTGRLPLQSTANLPVKPSSASQLRPGDGFTKPPSRPQPLPSAGRPQPPAGRPQPLPSAGRPQPQPNANTRPQPILARPGLASSAGTSRPPASSSGGKPTKPGGPQASSASRPLPAKPTESQSSSGSLGATATFGKTAGDKQHRWKLDDFDIGRPLGKVSIVLL